MPLLADNITSASIIYIYIYIYISNVDASASDTILVCAHKLVNYRRGAEDGCIRYLRRLVFRGVSCFGQLFSGQGQGANAEARYLKDCEARSDALCALLVLVYDKHKGSATVDINRLSVSRRSCSWDVTPTKAFRYYY
jgi:hypothetical protein